MPSFREETAIKVQYSTCMFIRSYVGSQGKGSHKHEALIIDGSYKQTCTVYSGGSWHENTHSYGNFFFQKVVHDTLKIVPN